MRGFHAQRAGDGPRAAARPPDNWPGYFRACSGIFTLSRKCMARLVGLLLGDLADPDRCQRAVFEDGQMRGRGLKCWNTMPTSRRTSSIFLRSLVSSMPSDGDGAFLVLFQPVDAADHGRLARSPTARRPRCARPRITFRLMSLSTWKYAIPLCMSTISMATSVVDTCILARLTESSSALTLLSPHFVSPLAVPPCRSARPAAQTARLGFCARCPVFVPCRWNRRDMPKQKIQNTKAGEDQAGHRRLGRHPVGVSEVLADRCRAGRTCQ